MTKRSTSVRTPAKSRLDRSCFNPEATLPYDLRITDFQGAMEDVYDFFHDVNSMLIDRGLERLDEMMRPAALSGMISDMLTASLARKSRTLVENRHFNGHPDLLVRGRYPGNKVQSGTDGVEIKSTRKSGGAVDLHGARDQWMCVFVYKIDLDPDSPAHERAPLCFTEVYLGEVVEGDFRKNARSELGTKTATLHREGIAKLRKTWLYMLPKPPRARAKRKSAKA